jgi:DNA-binding MarR family transcriptional regulator
MYKPGRIRSDRWYEIALLCRDQPRTVPAIAGAMDVDPGSIQSLIASMRRENLLKEAESDARGVALKLTRRGRSELRRRETPGSIGQLSPTGERLVFVTEDGHGVAAEALAQIAAEPSFRWAVRIDGPVKWIASFGSSDAAAADRAANSLDSAGARAVVGRSDACYDASELAAFAMRVEAKPLKPLLQSTD